MCQQVYKWCDLHWQPPTNLSYKCLEDLVFPSQGWVRLKQGVSLGRFSTLALWNGLWNNLDKPIAFGTPVKFLIEWTKGSLLLGWTDVFNGKSSNQRGSPFHKGLENKNKGIVLPWKGGRKQGEETVLKERYTEAWSRHLGKAVSLRYCLLQILVRFIFMLSDGPVGIQYLL